MASFSSFSSIENEATNILLSRPGFYNDSVAIRKGPKQSSKDISHTSKAVDSCLENFHTTLEFPKVRKSNIGTADWISSRGLAFVTKSGKFSLTMGHRTSDSNICLLPEETLYLLSAGDIELCLNNYPLSLEDAFTIIFNTESTYQCTIEEYQVFCYLVNLGFVVTRFGFDYSKEKLKLGPILPELISEGINNNCYHARENTVTYERNNNMKKPSRGWWICSDQKSSSQKVNCETSSDSMEVICKNNATQAQSFNILTSNTTQNENKVELYYSHSRKPDIEKCKQNVKNWKEYKENLKNEINMRNNHFINLLNQMNNMKQRPLLHPLKANYLQQVYKCIKITEEVAFLPLHDKDCTSTIAFNIFKPQSSGFKKSFPGPPCARITVSSASTHLPSLQIQSHLSSMCGAVPLVYAIVDEDQIAFYEINSNGIQQL